MEKELHTNIICCDSASWVSIYKLDLHVDSSKKVLIFGANTRPRSLVKQKRENLAAIAYHRAAITKQNIEVAVEIASQGRDQNTHEYIKKQHQGDLGRGRHFRYIYMNRPPQKEEVEPSIYIARANIDYSLQSGL